MAYQPKRVELSRNSFDPSLPATPLDYARQRQTNRVECDMDMAILNRVEKDHSPAIRPEVRGASDTVGWNRYGGGDGDGPHGLVVGRAATAGNRRER
jgi:hypothetical protein